MRYRVLGGVRVSVVGLGFWEVGGTVWGGAAHGVDTAVSVLEAAVSEGVNFVDTAELYGRGRSERLLGEAARRLGVVDDIHVATKVAGFRVSVEEVVRAVEASARRLGFKPWLVQHHWPPPRWVDLCKPLRGLEEAWRRGLTEHIGVSNYPGRLLEEARSCLRRAELLVDQVEWSLAAREAEADVKPVADRLGVTVVAWGPLAEGALAGRKPHPLMALTARRYWRAARDRALQGALEKLARRYHASKAQIAIAWLIAKGALPIPGSRNPRHVRENARAADVKLSEADVKLLDKVSERYIGSGRYGGLRVLRYIPATLQKLIWLAGA